MYADINIDIMRQKTAITVDTQERSRDGKDLRAGHIGNSLDFLQNVPAGIRIDPVAARGPAPRDLAPAEWQNPVDHWQQ